MLTQDEHKKIVGYHAIDTLIDRNIICNDAKVGLGTGSTAIHAVYRLGEHIKNGKIKNIKAVVTSLQTQCACEDCDIPVYTLNSKAIDGILDVSIDGADEIDPENNLIKGGGAAHVLEKIVEYNSKVFVVIADSSKLVPHLGTKFPLPVEFIGAARLSVQKSLEKMGAVCKVRSCAGKAGPIITDNGNQILDCVWKSPVNPQKMEDTIKAITGVVEVGFFTKLKPIVFTVAPDGKITEQ